MAIIQELRNLLTQRADNLTEIASAINLDIAELSAFAEGKSSISLEVAERIAAHFDVRLEAAKWKWLYEEASASANKLAMTLLALGWSVERENGKTVFTSADGSETLTLE